MENFKKKGIFIMQKGKKEQLPLNK